MLIFLFLELKVEINNYLNTEDDILIHPNMRHLINTQDDVLFHPRLRDSVNNASSIPNRHKRSVDKYIIELAIFR